MMKQTFDTDSILYAIIKASPVSGKITGGVYVGERPDNSHEEDIVVNSINITQEYFPQLGASNVNIHVPDMEVSINGKKQTKANRKRLEELSTEVLKALKDATTEGMALIVAGQNVLKEPDFAEHYTNFRVEWIIHN